MRILRPVVGLAAAGALIAAAGCGSSGGAGSSGSGGGPIKLLVVSQLQASTFSFPEIEDGARAAAAAINAAGGVAGHRIQVDACNDQGDPNIAGTCARTAVQQHYAGVIMTTELYSASVLPLLESAKIPAVGSVPLTAPDFTSPVSFPLSGGNPVDYGGIGYSAGKTGCKTAAIIRDTASSVDESVAAMTRGAKAAGLTLKVTVKSAGTSADFASPVSQVVSSGAECLLLAEQPTAIAKIVGAVRQSAKPAMPIYTAAVALPPALVKALGAAANGVIVDESVQLPNASVTPKFWADMTKYRPSAPRTTSSYQSWAAVQIVKAVAGPAKAFTGPDLMSALTKANAVTVEGLAQTLNYSKPRTGTSFPRIFNTSIFAWKINKGSYQPLFNGKAQEISSVLRG
jgi:ABC-type branched-subunit amino acid transport system substrate-binding protein